MGTDGVSLLDMRNVDMLNGAAALWAGRMAHACLSGGGFALGVWAVCRLAPRLPAPVRGWLWWLACLKLALDLCWAAPLPLPLLPASPLATAQAGAKLPVTLPAVSDSNTLGKMVVGNAGHQPEEDSRRVSGLPAARPSLPLCLLLIWCAGVMGSILLAGRQGLRLRRIVRAASDTPLDAAPKELAARIGLRRVPRVFQSPSVAAPCVAGLWRPVILLPPGLAQTLSPDELRLTLAHEMAHIRRGDLRLALLPAFVRALFFFHPLLWLACAEWSAAREEACDALALQATGAGASDFGCLLLKMASGKTEAPALGLSPGYHGLRRRLVSLTRPSPMSRRARWLLALALPLLLPWRLTAASGLHSVLPSPEEAAPTRYDVSDLGDVTGRDSEAVGLNNAGQVAGTTRAGDEEAQGFTGNPARPVPLGALPKHHYSIAYGINAGGQVAAASYNIPGHGRAFLWNGAPHRLGSLPGFPYSEARGVNDAGQVAGFADTGSEDRWKALVARAFLWTDGQMTDLGTLGGPYSYAYGLNNAGTVVGKADTSVFGQTHAFSWQNGQMTDLGTLGGANSLAYRINDQAQIVGSSETGAGDTRHAFLWQNGQMRDLGALPGTTDSVAYDVNANGDAVGSAEPALDSPIKRAFLWRNGRLTDLNTLLPPHSGWTLQEARAINDRGQIAGVGMVGGHTRAFLLTPR